MRKVRYEEMLPDEIVKRREIFPAAFMGLGGLEWHGEHLAVGLDTLKAERLCVLAAMQSGGFAFPPVWYGEPRIVHIAEVSSKDSETIMERMHFNRKKFTEHHFGKTPDEQIHLFQELIYHILVQMNTLEMRGVCLVCGHHPLCGWILPVVQQFNTTFCDTKAFAGIESDFVSREENVGLDHAAKWETSYIMHLRPDCVDMGVYSGSSSRDLVGVGGEDPRKGASAALGEKACNAIISGIVAKAKELVQLATTRQ